LTLYVNPTRIGCALRCRGLGTLAVARPVRTAAAFRIAAIVALYVIPTCAVLTLEAVRRTKPAWPVDDEDEPR